MTFLDVYVVNQILTTIIIITNMLLVACLCFDIDLLHLIGINTKPDIYPCSRPTVLVVVDAGIMCVSLYGAHYSIIVLLIIP